MNNHFWSQLGSSFHTTVMQRTGFIFLFLVLALVILVSVLYYIKKRLDLKKESQALRFFEIGSSSEVFEILQAALDLNSRFDLSLKGQTRELFCTFKRMEKDFLVLEPSAQVKISKKFLDRDVEVFFKVKPGKKKVSFYKFNSRIADIFEHEDTNLIRINFPDILEMEQKRQHLRLDVPQNCIRKLEVRKVSHDEHGKYHKALNSFGEPLWSIPPEGETQEITLVDISGGGIRLRLPSREYFLDKEFLKGKPSLLISIILADEPKSDHQAEHFHLIGKMKKQYFDGFGNHVFSLQYQYTAIIDKHSKAITGWEMVDPEEGVEDLTKWVVKMHLKMYREKGLA